MLIDAACGRRSYDEMCEWKLTKCDFYMLKNQHKCIFSLNVNIIECYLFFV